MANLIFWSLDYFLRLASQLRFGLLLNKTEDFLWKLDFVEL